MTIVRVLGREVRGHCGVRRQYAVEAEVGGSKFFPMLNPGYSSPWDETSLSRAEEMAVSVATAFGCIAQGVNGQTLWEPPVLQTDSLLAQQFNESLRAVYRALAGARPSRITSAESLLTAKQIVLDFREHFKGLSAGQPESVCWACGGTEKVSVRSGWEREMPCPLCQGENHG